MNKISAVVITLNEEAKIGGCIASIHDIVDEVIVVDSYSTDQTAEICRSFEKVRFVQNKFIDYTRQKNFAVSLSSSDYILSLDADEELDQCARAEVKKIKLFADADAYAWRRKNHFCGRWIKHGAWYPDRKVRLWNKEKGQWAGPGLHETVLLTPGTKMVRLKGHIIHFTIDRINDYIAGVEKFSNLSTVSTHKGSAQVSMSIIINPLVRFCRDYFFKMGFLDGFYGLLIAVTSAYSVFIKYSKIKFHMLQKDQKHEMPHKRSNYGISVPTPKD